MKQGNTINSHGVMDQEDVQLEYQLLQKNKDKGIYFFLLKHRYFEDRRPAANIDPYLVSAALVDVTCLNGEHLK